MGEGGGVSALDEAGRTQGLACDLRVRRWRCCSEARGRGIIEARHDPKGGGGEERNKAMQCEVKQCIYLSICPEV